MSESSDVKQLFVVLALDSPGDGHSHHGAESLISRIEERIGCHVLEAGNGSEAISQAVDRAIAQGANRVVVVPAQVSPCAYGESSAICQAVENEQAAHPDVEVICSGPLLAEEEYEDLVVGAIRRQEAATPEMISLDRLPIGRVGVVQDLRGWRHFVCRMVSLGFTPGTEVRVIQNYGRGPLIANVRNTRVALGCREARKVLVVEKREGKK